MIQCSIQRMYEEISSYHGGFGDPVAEFVDFEPLAVLGAAHADKSVRQGAAIGLLVNFAVALDNTDHASALTAKAYGELEVARQAGLLKEFPPIEAAAMRARDGEQEFGDSLAAVYLAYVQNAR